jgi:hypothetical protein
MDSDNNEPFLYTGQSSDEIPQNVRHAKVDPTVKAIHWRAFKDRKQLIEVELNEGLECIDEGAFHNCYSLTSIFIPSTVQVIGWGAFKNCHQLRNVELSEGLEFFQDTGFRGCRSLTCIRIPSTVRVIGEKVFKDCRRLRNVELNDGLEHIDRWAFEGCTSLEQISFPSTVKVIGEGAFRGCSHLRIVELREGLERINTWAFAGCTSLESIRIPFTVIEVGQRAFRGCNNLAEIEFCDEMEQFVNEASLPWWNHGVSEVSLRAYSFLAQHNIPARMDTIKVQKWKNNIHNMLQRIPEELKKEEEEEENDESEGDNYFYEFAEEVNDYFFSIEARLANYEHLQEVAPFLELALWKAKIMEQSNGSIINNKKKILCRINSFSMFAIIFPNVLSFLFEE